MSNWVCAGPVISDFDHKMSMDFQQMIFRRLIKLEIILLMIDWKQTRTEILVSCENLNPGPHLELYLLLINQ